jgi:large repetitive protein
VPACGFFFTDQDGNVLGSAVVDADGNWSFESVELADGTYTITAVQVDEAGNVSPESSPVIFTVDTIAPDAPVITSPQDGDIVGVDPPVITGTGEPGATVEVTISEMDQRSSSLTFQTTSAPKELRKL